MAKKELTDVMLRNLKVSERTEFTDTRQIGLEVHAYLKHLKVPLQVIDEILAHKAASKDENVSKALSNYLSAAFIGDMITNPQAEALDKFAEVIERIEADAKARAKAA